MRTQGRTDMGDDVNYEELVDGTVDEVKQRVQEDELDIDAVLEAERNSKDRVTLVEWLEERREDEPSADPEETATSAPRTVSGDTLLEARHSVFGAGLLAGLLVAALVVTTGFVPVGGTTDAGQVSTDVAADRLDTYLSDNQDVFLPPQIRNSSSITVSNVAPYEDTELYQATLAFTMTVRNQSQTQEVTGFMTEDAEFIVFGGQPFSLDQPAAEQVQRQRTARP